MNEPNALAASATAGPERARLAQELRRAAAGFEAIFAKMLVEQLERTTESGLFGGSPSGEIYGSLFREELSQELGRRESLGIAKALYQRIAPVLGLDPNEDTPLPGRVRRAAGTYESIERAAPPPVVSAEPTRSDG